MDFVERTLHVSPDGGNGSFELVVFGILATLAVLAFRGAARRRAAARPVRPSPPDPPEEPR
jgi:hypothetical protein